MAREFILALRLSTQERATIEAASNGLTLSSYIRQAALAQAKRDARKPARTGKEE